MSDRKEIHLMGLSKVVDIPEYSDEMFAAARERLLRHRQSSLKFQAKLSSAVGATLADDYAMGRISHNYFSRCVFDGASLKRVAGAGSIFSETDFVKTDLSYATFQSSTFENCTFQGCDLEGCNMSECYFQDTVWDRCIHGAANMSFTRLNRCRFLGTKPGNLAEATLENVYLEDIRLANMNLEFATFQSITTKDVILPFSQLPYIFGGLKYLIDTDDNVRISSHINSSDSISVDEYVAVLKDMEIFYSHQREYFPLTNILLAFHKDEAALAAVLCGVGEAAVQKDFRMCKYYCKLLTSHGRFPAETLRKLYEAICRAAPVRELTEAQYYQYCAHIPEIRSMLIENPNRYPHAELRLDTKICSANATQVSLLVSHLDRCLHLTGSPLTLPSISISHNSPVTLVLNLCGTPLGILAIGALIFSMISSVCKTYNEVAEAILNTQNIIKNRHEIKQTKLEVQKLSAEVAKLEEKNPGLQAQILTAQKEITESGIVIVHAALDGKDFDPSKWL